MTPELRAEWLLALRTEPPVRRWLERQVASERVRARPDFVPTEQLARLEARAAREYELVCVVCGEQFTAKRPDARTCSGACRVRRCKLRRRAGREAIAA